MDKQTIEDLKVIVDNVDRLDEIRLRLICLLDPIAEVPLRVHDRYVNVVLPTRYIKQIKEIVKELEEL